MLSNYFKTAFRNILRYKMYSSINLLGLAIAMACCILIFLYVQYELGYDRFFRDYNRTYRVSSVYSTGGKTTKVASSPIPLLTVFRDYYPEVESTVRFLKVGFNRKKLITYKDRKIYEDEIYYTDPSVFSFFDYALLKGNAASALKDPYALVLTETLARKVFGAENPIGEVVRIGTKTFRVTGIVQNPPAQSHIRYAALVSMATVYDDPKSKEFLTSWLSSSVYSYVKLKPDAEAGAVERGFSRIYKKYIEKEGRNFNTSYGIFLQPVPEIHLHSHLEDEFTPPGDPYYIYVLSSVAVFILIVACINYMNLATARFAGRSREVGIRKVLGAVRGRLARQFAGESLILAFGAGLLALVLAEFLLPVFGMLAERPLSIDYTSNGALLLLIALVVVFAGLLSGSYPALFLSRFEPVDVLKGKFRLGRSASFFRRALVVVQFTVSIVLIIGTFFIYNQLTYMRRKQLGFDREGLTALNIHTSLLDSTVVEKIPVLKAKLEQGGSIERVAMTDVVPGSTEVNKYLIKAGDEHALTEKIVQIIFADTGYLSVMKIDLLKGRPLRTDERISDFRKGVLINESMARLLGGTEAALGKRIQFGFDKSGKLAEEFGTDARVVGVVRDFHIQSLHREIEPLVISLFNKPLNKLFVRFRAGEEEAGRKYLERVWAEVYPGFPLEHYGIDTKFEQQYNAEKKMAVIFLYASAVSIFIACLGLFGLSSFITERRSREIAVRKVIGASTWNILLLIWKEFLLLLLLSVLIAWPIAFFAAENWLETFPYRISVPWAVFPLSGLIALLLALATVSYNALRAAFSDPVRYLKYE